VAAPITQAVVLAGGRGTRLGELTAETPKPLLDVGGRPFIEWVIDNLARQGVERVVLTVGYRAEAFERWLAGYDGSVEVDLFAEDEPLGTGGALTLLLDQLDNRVLVLNGDTLFDADLPALAGMLGNDDGDDPDAIDAAIALRAVDDTGRYGAVALSDGVLADFAEKNAAGPGLINGGVYALRSRVLRGPVGPMSIERDLMPELVRMRRVRGLPCDAFFIDIGVPETYRDAQKSVPAWWARVTS
jgi:NDP-sugar pyrophosphorylase family protein